jgi:hypothetical protein
MDVEIEEDVIYGPSTTVGYCIALFSLGIELFTAHICMVQDSTEAYSTFKPIMELDWCRATSFFVLLQPSKNLVFLVTNNEL